MDKKEIACPYCGHMISNDEEKCPNCGEYFIEPNLSEFKFISIPLYLAGESVLSAFGFPLIYSLIWIIINHKNICNIAIQKDKNKFNILLFLFGAFVIFTIVSKFFILIDLILEIFLAYRILRIIEKFTIKKYNSPIIHHGDGMIFFRTLYVIYFIDTYLIRVKDPAMRYCLNIGTWFKYIVMLSIIIGILYVLGLFSIPILKI